MPVEVKKTLQVVIEGGHDLEASYSYATVVIEMYVIILMHAPLLFMAVRFHSLMHFHTTYCVHNKDCTKFTHIVIKTEDSFDDFAYFSIKRYCGCLTFSTL